MSSSDITSDQSSVSDVLEGPHDHLLGLTGTLHGLNLANESEAPPLSSTTRNEGGGDGMGCGKHQLKSPSEVGDASTPTPKTLEGDLAAAPECDKEGQVPSASDHPFETEPGDHAETPFDAYEHIAPLLTRLARRLDTTPAALRIYDPYYCEGR